MSNRKWPSSPTSSVSATNCTDRAKVHVGTCLNIRDASLARLFAVHFTGIFIAAVIESGSVVNNHNNGGQDRARGRLVRGQPHHYITATACIKECPSKVTDTVEAATSFVLSRRCLFIHKWRQPTPESIEYYKSLKLSCYNGVIPCFHVINKSSVKTRDTVTDPSAWYRAFYHVQ